jgi:hypothetical protein
VVFSTPVSARSFRYPTPTAHAKARTLPDEHLLVTMALLHSPHLYCHRINEGVEFEHVDLVRTVRIDYSVAPPFVDDHSEPYAVVRELNPSRRRGDVDLTESSFEGEAGSSGDGVTRTGESYAVARFKPLGVHLFPVLTPRKGRLLADLEVRDRDGTPLRVLSHHQHLDVSQRMLLLRLQQLTAQHAWEPVLQEATTRIAHELRRLPAEPIDVALGIVEKVFRPPA